MDHCCMSSWSDRSISGIGPVRGAEPRTITPSLEDVFIALAKTKGRRCGKISRILAVLTKEFIQMRRDRMTLA